MLPLSWLAVIWLSLVAVVVGETLSRWSLLGGAVTTETIFAWPGIGRYIVESISNKDTPCVLGAVVMLAVIVTVINLLVDIIYAFVDPRIKSQYKTMVRRAAKHG